MPLKVSPPQIGFVLELSLGHTTHAQNLTSSVIDDFRILSQFRLIPFELSGFGKWVPGYQNWTIRAGVRARRAIHEMKGAGKLDALFIHTQVPAILSPDYVGRIPTVVSLDATPAQYDELGTYYQHQRSGRLLEALKWRAHRACFARAARIVTWSAWAKAGLVERYEVDADKVVVIPPGVDTDRWCAPPDAHRRSRRSEPFRVLFVGGDLERKGGLDLVDAWRLLRKDGLPVELHLVTRQSVPMEPGLVIHHGLEPNSAGLIELYHDADIFCLPTKADCLGVALIEAGAAGLPLVATDVGAIKEIVRDGETGLLTPAHSPQELAQVLASIILNPELSRRLGEQARAHVAAEFNSKLNARRLVDLLVDVASEN